MIITLAALRGLGTAPRVLLALVATAVALTAAAPVQASTPTGPATPSFLAQGAGMGDRPSAAVRRVQRVLHRRGYDLGAPGVDGRFGPITGAAVRRMQLDHGLTADGIVGPRTRRALGLTAAYRRASVRPRPHPNRRAKREHGRARPRPVADGATAASDPTRSEASTTTPRPATATTTPGAAAPTTGTRDTARPIPATSRHDNTGFPWGLVVLIAGIGVLVGFAAVGDAHRRDRDEDRGTEAADRHTLAGLPAGQPEALASDVPTRHLGSAPAPAVHTPDRHSGGPPTRPSPAARAGVPVIGYLTLGADEPAEHADDPARALAATAAASGWDLVDVVMDREGGYGLARRELRYALRQIADGRARGLLIRELRTLNPSLSDLGALLEWFRDAGAVLVALDLELDTSTPVGRQMAEALMTLGMWERVRIATRTPSRPAAGEWSELAQRIARMRATGMSLQAIADQLNDEGVPTVQGGASWRPASVQAALGASRPAPPSPRDQLPPLRDAMR